MPFGVSREHWVVLLSWRVTSPCPLGDHTSVVEGSDGSCGILVSLSSQGAGPIVHTRDRECPCLTLHGQSCPHSCKEQECLCPEGSPQRAGASHCRRPATGAQPVKVHRVLLPDRKLSPHPVLSSLGTVWAHPFSPPEQSSSVITGA